MAHPDRLLGAEAREHAFLRADRDDRWAVLALIGAHDVAAELHRHELGAVADPQDRQASAPERGIGLRSALVIDRVGSAREDDALRAAPLQLVHRRVVREQLGVHVELTDATRDELRELAPEVEHDDAVGRLGRHADRGAVVRPAIGGRRVESDLEIRLHLGVVRRQHAVAGVGFLAMDGPAALPRLRLGRSALRR